MFKRVHWPGLWLGLLVFMSVAGCNPGPTPIPPTSTPLALTPGMFQVVPGCEAPDVDNWSEEALYLVGAFGDVMTEAAETERGALDPLIGQMYRYKRSLDDLPVPAGCALETHEMIHRFSLEIINVFEAYRNDSSTNSSTNSIIDSSIDIQTVVEQGQSTQALIEARIYETMGNMQATYDASQSD